MRRLGDQRGLSLTELLVVTAILAAIAALTYATFRYQAHMLRRETATATSQKDLRVWVGRMVKDIRRAGFDPYDTTTSAFAFQAAAPTEIRFGVDIDSDGALDTNERLGFRLNVSTLEATVNNGATWRPVLAGVTSLALTYFDAQGTQVNAASPYTLYAPIAEVKVVLTAEVTEGGGPGSVARVLSETARVTLRNPS